MASDGSVVFSTELDESGLKGALSGLGSKVAGFAKAAGAALATVGTGLAAVTTKALGLAGQLEQNIGGSEAIFAQYAKTVQDTAATAFETMGLSQSDYLSTANKMGALFKGAGFETEEAMNITTQAMQRAADVASIMGIDTTWAMESIAGAAKGNFTMMDNLGVAMNDTTLQAYALEKGIKKSTQSMTTQEKIGLAMEMFLERTSYAAGNYAAENATLAGALGTAQAALNNFLSGAGSADQLINSLSNAAQVIVKNFDELLPKLADGLVQAIDGLVPMVPPLIMKVMDSAANMLPTLTKAAVSLVDGVVKGISSNAKAIAKGLAGMLTQAIKELVPMIPTLLTGLVVVFTELFTSLAGELPDMIPTLIEALIDGILTLIENAPELLAAGMAIMQGLGAGIYNALPMLFEQIPEVLQAFLSQVSSIWESSIWPVIQGLFKAVFGVDLPPWGEMVTQIDAWWNGSVWPQIQDFFQETFGVELPDWQGVSTAISDWWDKVKASFVGLFEATFSLFTEDEDGKEAATRIAEWGDKVLAALSGVFEATFGIKLPDNIEDISKSISEWWDRVKLATKQLIVDVFGIKMPDLDKIVQQLKDWWDSVLKDLGDWFSIHVGVDTKDTRAYAQNESYGKPAEGPLAKWWNSIWGIETPATDAAKDDALGAQAEYENAAPGVRQKITEVFTPEAGASLPMPLTEASTADTEGAVDAVNTGMQNAAGAIDAGADSIKTSAQNATIGAVNAANAEAAESYVVGENLSAGIAMGINQNSGLVASAMQRLIAQGLSAAKKAARIASPSGLFADEVGAFIPAGAAVGVDNNAWMLRQAIDHMLTDSVPSMQETGLGQMTPGMGQWQAGSAAPVSALDTGGLAATVAAAVREGMSTVSFILNGERVASFVSRTIAEEAWEERYG